MKNPPIKTLSLIILSLINVSLLIVSTISFKASNKQVTPPNNTSYASPEGLTNYYIIKKGNLVETQSKNGNVIFTDDTIITYKVTKLNSTLKCFDDVNKGFSLGEYYSDSVVAKSFGKIMAITDDGEYIYISVYQYDQVYINMFISYEDFYLEDISTQKYSFKLGKNDIQLKYENVDYSFENSSKIKVVFSIINNKYVLSNNYAVTLYKFINEFKDVYFIENFHTLPEGSQGSFEYIDNLGNVNTIKIFCSKNKCPVFFPGP